MSRKKQQYHQQQQQQQLYQLSSLLKNKRKKATDIWQKKTALLESKLEIFSPTFPIQD